METEQPDEAPEWWVRRVVLAMLVVVAAVTTVYAVFATRSDDDGETASDGSPVEVVTTFTPDDQVSEGPLRLGEMLVVGRMGAPVEVPTGTAESYAAAIEAGVGYVEAQVVMTQDGELVVRPDNELGLSTDVADRDEFADRETTKVIDDEEITGWFSEDFTLAELQTLKAIEPRPDLRPGPAEQDGDFSVISFDDLLTQVGDHNREAGTEVGVFVQPVRASYFRSERLAMEPAIAKSLRKARLVNEAERVTVESSDLALLDRIEGNVGDNVLSGYVVDAASADDLTATALADLPDTVDVILVEVGAFAELDDPQGLPDVVHDAGFAIAIYPISYENALLGGRFVGDGGPSDPGDLKGFLEGLRALGVDAVMADSPAEVVAALGELDQEDPSPSESSSSTPG